MKKLIYCSLFVSTVMVSCSKDDDKKCDSCEVQGEKIEICDNGDGTYDLKSGGTTQKISESDLAGLTAKEYIDAICVLGNSL